MAGPQFLGVTLCCQEFCSSLSTRTDAPEIKILLTGNKSKHCLLCGRLFYIFLICDILQKPGTVTRGLATVPYFIPDKKEEVRM